MTVTPTPLRALLALLIFWVVEQGHLPTDLGMKGLNPINLLFLVCLLILLSLRLPKSAPTPIRGAFLFFIAMLVWAFVAGQLRDGSLMMDDLTALKNAVFFICLYFLFFHAVRDERTIHLMVLAMLGVAGLGALEGVREGMDYGFGVYSETKRAAGPFGDDYRASNLLAVFLAIFTPPFVGLALYAKKHPLLRAAAIGGVVLMVLATFVTYSRQAYVIVTFTILALTMRRNLVLGLLVLLALANYEYWVPEGVVDRIAMTEQVGTTGEVKLDESTESRFELWEAAAELRRSTPWGIGLNHFKREVGAINSKYSGMDAHNFVVLISTEAGYLGFVATITLYLALLWLGWSLLRVADAPEAKAMAMSFLVATLALILGNMYGSRLLDGAVVGNYWVFAALVARYRVLIQSGERTASASNADAPTPADPPGMRPLRPAAPQPRRRDRNGRLLPIEPALPSPPQDARRRPR